MANQLGRRREQEAITATIVETIDGFNAHDAKRATQAYMPESDLVTVRGEVLEGKAEIERRLAEVFATRGKHVTQRMLNVKIRFIRDDVALAHVGVEMSGLVAPDGQPLPPHQELNLRVFVRDGGSWRVAAFHNTVVAGPATARPG
jgi:uncharacterized protein (TIGR02246 family)